MNQYKCRKYNEELLMIEELGGTCYCLKILGLAAISEKLHCNLERGLTPVDFNEREAAFGSNKKDPM